MSQNSLQKMVHQQLQKMNCTLCCRILDPKAVHCIAKMYIGKYYIVKSYQTHRGLKISSLQFFAKKRPQLYGTFHQLFCQFFAGRQPEVSSPSHMNHPSQNSHPRMGLFSHFSPFDGQRQPPSHFPRTSGMYPFQKSISRSIGQKLSIVL